MLRQVVMPMTMAAGDSGGPGGRPEGIDTVRGSARIRPRVDLDLDAARDFLPCPRLPRRLVVAIERITVAEDGRPGLWSDLRQIPPVQRILRRRVDSGVLHLVQRVVERLHILPARALQAPRPRHEDGNEYSFRAPVLLKTTKGSRAEQSTTIAAESELHSHK